MFDRLRKAFGTSGSPGSDLGRPATNRDVARWAAKQQLAIVAHSTEGHFDLGGDIHGHPWRLECGAPTRDYVTGLELRGRAEGTFRGGIDPVQLYVSIAGLAYFYLSNNHTLSAIFGRDLMTPKARSERLSHMCEVILGYVLRN